MSVVAVAVVPVFGTVVLGYGLARSGLFGRDTGAGLVRFMYYLAIPAMLFSSLAAADLPAEVPWHYLAAFYLPSLAIFMVTMSLSRSVLGWRKHEAGMAGMSAAYSNMVLLGFPLTLSAFGPVGAIPMFILLATQSTFLFPLTTYTLEMNARVRRSGARAHAHTIAKLALNPVILSLLLGVAANISGYSPPDAIDRMLTLLSGAGPACALVALGISLAEYRLRGGYRDVVALVLIKNFVHPLLVWLGCLVFAVDREWMHVAVVLAAMPVGINAFIFASQYDVRQETVSKSIVVSTAISSVVATVLLFNFIK